ncbi:MAG: hypothetical protein K9N51_01745 [Candidatus Pacebacteria bacterium]|nr:hypothetical protein [Candidatus Paceibacterota bacterium]
MNTYIPENQIAASTEVMEPGSEYDPGVHNRRSLRLRGHNYAGEGTYFVTICTTGRRHWFGEVVNGRVALNDAGRAADRCWREIPVHFPNVVLDEWVVMPDHVHGIIIMRDVTGNGTDVGAKNGVGAKNFSPLPGRDGRERPRGTSRTLGSVIRGFKIGVTKNMDGTSPWQRNYYDVIVRNDRALKTIRRYIRNNPSNWNVLRYGEPRFFLGKRNLMDLSMTAFLASRTRTRIDVFDHGWLDDVECVVSGFLSPVERAVFNECLARGIPLVQILAAGLPATVPHRMRRAIDAGRLLIATPFDSNVENVNASRAVWCNQYVLHLASRVIVGYLNQDGMLACLLSEDGVKRNCMVLHQSKME